MYLSYGWIDANSNNIVRNKRAFRVHKYYIIGGSIVRQAFRAIIVRQAFQAIIVRQAFQAIIVRQAFQAIIVHPFRLLRDLTPHADNIFVSMKPKHTVAQWILRVMSEMKAL
jgi:hypothetical protein